MPFIAAVTWHRHQPAPVLAARRNSDSLITDVAVAIGPDHIFRGSETVTTRVFKLLPTMRLIHSQARQIWRPANFHPRRAHGIRDVVRLVFINDRTVSG